MRRTLGKIPLIGPAVVFGLRAVTALRLIAAHAHRTLRWLFTSREYTNLTYDLEPLNQLQMQWFLADLLGIPPGQVGGYFAEILADRELAGHISARIAQSDEAFGTDRAIRLGRRLVWYALARAIKPRLIVETGIDKGLGSCVLCAALSRNAAEGVPGHYIGVDINPRAGFLFSGPYRRYGELVISDSLAFLRDHHFENGVDIFINDSDHSATHEQQEYRLVNASLAANAYVIADNAHVTDELLRFAESSGRRYRVFHEHPKNHWYRGCAIGIAFGKPAPPGSAPQSHAAIDQQAIELGRMALS